MKKCNRGSILAFLGVLAFVSGCASLQFSETSLRLSEFDPKTVAVLPFTNTLGMEQANESTNAVLASELQRAGKFTRIVEPGQVKALMVEREDIMTAITNFRTKWVATGYADKAAIALICKTLDVDSVMFGEISQWGTQNAGTQVYVRAGVNLRWVDKSSEILWKLSHSKEVQSSILFAPKPENVMKTVIQQIISAWPKKAST